MTNRMTRAEKQQAKLAALEAMPAGQLTTDQLLKLAKLKKKRDVGGVGLSADAADKAEEPKEAQRAVADKPAGKEGRKRKSESSAAEQPQKRPVVGPCSDEGAWNANGEWEYPADKTISCGLCKADFVFTGAEQSWYAQKKLYPPARCATCIAAKKESKEAKKASGRSGEGRCFRCGASGHLSSACTRPSADTTAASGRKSCYVCGSEEHLSRNCPNASAHKKTKAGGCFTCNSTEHMSRECPHRPPPVCYNCGSTGHASKTCDQPKRSSGECFAFAKGQCHSKKCLFSHARDVD